MKIGIAISCFKNDDDVIALVTKIVTQSWPVEAIIIVDSLGGGKIQEYLTSNKIKNTEYFNYDTNLGSAGNLKKRLMLSAEKDWDFVLALNHDALVTKITFLELIKYKDIPNLGAVYPLKYFPSKKFYDYSGTREVGPWRSFGEKSPSPDQIIPCIWSSSNGALYNLTPVREGIVPNEDLWMGWEDYLYGLDLKSSGYKQFLISNALCEDSYEFREKKLGFTKVVLASKPSWYTYYNTRNLFLICLFLHPGILRTIRIFIRSLMEFTFICLGWSMSTIKQSLKLQLRGARDGFNKINGKKDL